MHELKSGKGRGIEEIFYDRQAPYVISVFGYFDLIQIEIRTEIDW